MPILFLNTLYEILCAAIESNKTAIRWDFSKHLENLNYADRTCNENDLAKESPKLAFKKKKKKTKRLKVKHKQQL